MLPSPAPVLVPVPARGLELVSAPVSGPVPGLDLARVVPVAADSRPAITPVRKEIHRESLTFSFCHHPLIIDYRSTEPTNEQARARLTCHTGDCFTLSVTEKELLSTKLQFPSMIIST
jgi:hypothetical protein